MSKTKTDQDDPGDVLMPDGRRLRELPPDETLKVYVEHTDPDSPRYNPGGSTARSSVEIRLPTWLDTIKAVTSNLSSGRTKRNAEKQQEAEKWKGWVTAYLEQREREGDRDFAGLKVEPEMVAKIKNDWTTDRKQQFPVAESTLVRFLNDKNAGTMKQRIESSPQQVIRPSEAPGINRKP